MYKKNLFYLYPFLVRNPLNALDFINKNFYALTRYPIQLEFKDYFLMLWKKLITTL